MSERTIEATYRKAIEVLLARMELRPYADISVQEIAKECGISRVTFYKYFADKDDLLWKAFRHVYLDVERQVERVDPRTLLSDGKPLSYYVFENVRINRGFYGNLFRNGMPYEFETRLLDHITSESFRTHELLRARYERTDIPYIRINQYLAGALWHLVRGLVLDQEDWDSLAMAEFFTALASPGVLGLLTAPGTGE